VSELNGRWLEMINDDPNALAIGGGKHQTSKQIEVPQPTPAALLEAA